MFPTRMYTLLCGWAKFAVDFFRWLGFGSWIDYQIQVPITQAASNYQIQLQTTKVNYFTKMFWASSSLQNIKVPCFLSYFLSMQK